MRLLEEAYDDDPARSEALLRRVAAREEPATARLYRPRPTVAFGRLDTLRDGFRAAQEAARERGFASVVRSVGGRAAAYTDLAVVYEELTPHDGLAVGLEERFTSFAGRLAGALRSLGADARVGEVAGEYCPGRFTVNAGGRVKLAGVAQRVISGAALVSAAVVVGDGERVRDVLVAVYEALDIDWDPATAGALEDVAPGVTVSDVVAALRRPAPPRRS